MFIMQVWLCVCVLLRREFVGVRLWVVTVFIEWYWCMDAQQPSAEWSRWLCLSLHTVCCEHMRLFVFIPECAKMHMNLSKSSSCLMRALDWRKVHRNRHYFAHFSWVFLFFVCVFVLAVKIIIMIVNVYPAANTTVLNTFLTVWSTWVRPWECRRFRHKKVKTDEEKTEVAAHHNTHRH